MQNNFIVVVKGISGSGKSSRVFQILKYLESKGFTLSDFHYTNYEGKDKIVGVLIEELNFVFIGKVYRTGDIERWQGYDSVTGSFGKASYFSDFLKENCSKYSFIVEGAGITQTHRLRPKFLNEEVGFELIMVQYYNYPEGDKQSYHDRIIYRSGEKPNKEAMWEKNEGFIKECGWSKEDSKNIDCVVFENNFDAEIYDLGVKFLQLIGHEKLISDFKQFTTDFGYINLNKHENFL
jgi:hypothetical protein